MRRLFVPLLLVACAACATAPRAAAPAGVRVAVVPALDAVGVTAEDAFLAVGPDAGEAERRAVTMRALAAKLAAALERSGVEACVVEPPPEGGGRPDAARLAQIGRDEGVDAVVVSELVAYGQVRRSWLWLLAAQGLVAGVAHGVIVARATGNPTAGWWVGAGEFVLETVTWVGGALVASKVIDPVIVRVRAVRSADGAEIGHWTREGTRPPRQWLRRENLPIRAERLRGVASGIFSKLAPKLSAKLESSTAVPATAAAKEGVR